MSYTPWIDWQETGSRTTAHDLQPCPFCRRRHLTLNVSFDDKAARVECRFCLAEGPWAWHEQKETVIIKAKENWNGQLGLGFSSDDVSPG